MIVVFILQLILPLQNFALYSGQNFRAYQLITHMFMHANIMHILSNIFIFILFSKSVEKYLGYDKFVMLFITSGIIGAFSQLMVCNSEMSMLGASAAIYGCTLASAFIKPNREIYLIFFRIKAKYLIGFLFLIEAYDMLMQNQDNIGHVAHVFGGLTGIIFYLFNRKLEKKSINL